MDCFLHTQTPAGEVKEYDYEYYDDTKPASPFVNPHDPTHRQVMNWPMAKKRPLGKLCQIFIEPQFQNFTLKGCFLTWRMQGLIKCWLLPSNGENIILRLRLLESAPAGIFINLKMKRSTILFSSFDQVKHNFAHFIPKK